jgi:pimeloyl-ACP methyl ester carboxylesterase
MLQQMESVLAADGTSIAFQRIGSGPPLVLVHGSLDDHRRWAGLLPALQERFSVVALDRRGRGGSGATDTATYAIESEFADVAAVVDATGTPVYLLGHSYGALCALEAARRTDNVAKLVLYEPPIPIPPGNPICPPGALAALETLLEAGDRDTVALTFAREIARVPEAEISALRDSPAWPAVTALAHTIVYEIRAAEGYVFDPSRFRNLATPTLLLVGSESAPFLQAASAAVAAALPHRRLATLPGQGHLAMDTDPEGFLRQVVAFLSEDDGPVAGRS